MSKFRKSPGNIPARWLHCPRKSDNLIVDKFLAFKTPLSSRFDDQVPLECRFPPKMIFDFGKRKKLKFGLWIDLTNTNRFYDKDDIEEYNCKYVKLQCRGHGETPSKEQADAFIKLVSTFISKHPLEHIAVHCTHGFNRTGFLIVSYLVEKLDFSLDVALETFAKARPTGIYKEDYMLELYRRYDDVEDAPPVRNLPDWCTESDDTPGSASLDDFDNPQDRMAPSSSNGNNHNPKANSNRAVPKFMEGVSGVTAFLEHPKAQHLKRKVQQMCAWKRKDFPGCQPVSMDTKNLKFLRDKPYRVSWKADGTRYMMLIDGEDEVYFFDRDNNVFKVKQLRFVHRKDIHRHLKNTLLDGEMVIDVVNGENIPRYLAYDVVKFEGQDVNKHPFYPIRLQCIENDIIRPRYEAMEKGLINKSAEPFSVRKKDFWDITQTCNLLGEKFAATLSHEPDGLIFQPSLDPYVPGRCDNVLKWKPASMNSVDFRLKIVIERAEGKLPEKKCLLFVGQDILYWTMPYSKVLKNMNNKIIECKFEDSQWKFMRERTDKSFPNSWDTARAVADSIDHPVTKEMLLDFIQHERYVEKDSDIMPPPPKRRR